MSVNVTGHPKAMNNYFYMNDKLYKVMQLIKASDYLTAWNFHDHGMEQFSYTYVRKYAEPAFRTKTVAEMVNRSPHTVRDCYQMGGLPKPKKVYPLGDGKHTPLLYSPIMWSKKDVLNLHDYLLERAGVERMKRESVGVIGSGDLPPRSEVLAALDHGTVYYVKDKDGKMIKVWKADVV